MRYIIGKFTQDQGVEIRRIRTRIAEIEARDEQIEDELALADETTDMDALWTEQTELGEERQELGESAIDLLRSME